MFEVYVLVEKKKPMFLSIFTVFSLVMGGISLLALMLGLFIFLPTAILGLLLGYFLHTRNYEFEYSFFDDEIRFAKIINKSKRKKIKGYKMAEVVAAFLAKMIITAVCFVAVYIVALILLYLLNKVLDVFAKLPFDHNIFLDRFGANHCHAVYGDHVDELKMICKMLDIDVEMYN